LVKNSELSILKCFITFFWGGGVLLVIFRNFEDNSGGNG